MTSVTEVRSASAHLFAGMWCPLVSVITTLLCYHFLSSSVVSRAFCVLCMYSKFRHHPHPLSYLCVKLVHGQKLCTQSTQSLTHSRTQSPSLFDAPGTKALPLRNSYQSLHETIIFRAASAASAASLQTINCWQSVNSNSSVQ